MRGELGPDWSREREGEVFGAGDGDGWCGGGGHWCGGTRWDCCSMRGLELFVEVDLMDGKWRVDRVYCICSVVEQGKRESLDRRLEVVETNQSTGSRATLSARDDANR